MGRRRHAKPFRLHFFGPIHVNYRYGTYTQCSSLSCIIIASPRVSFLRANDQLWYSTIKIFQIYSTNTHFFQFPSVNASVVFLASPEMKHLYVISPILYRYITPLEQYQQYKRTFINYFYIITAGRISGGGRDLFIYG